MTNLIEYFFICLVDIKIPLNAYQCYFPYSLSPPQVFAYSIWKKSDNFIRIVLLHSGKIGRSSYIWLIGKLNLHLCLFSLIFRSVCMCVCVCACVCVHVCVCVCYCDDLLTNLSSSVPSDSLFCFLHTYCCFTIT
jgi:hypothetical protein